jgi:3-deoxy-D-manno-octulosonate 8-phosphate phosphatase (KDO 8-P phosphatase)
MLGVTELYQGEQQKLDVIRRIADRHGIELSNIAYVGDDLVDLPPVSTVGLGVAVGDACVDLLERAPYVTESVGGRGAVRETVEAILRARGDWDQLVTRFLASI